MKPVMFVFSLLLVADTIQAQVARRDPQPRVRYQLGPDSQPREGIPKGQLEGPFLFHSKIIENTVRKYWVFVPAQYDVNEAACVLVFQDGARAVNPEGVLMVPQVLENLIANKQIPVTIGIFITPGQRGDEFPDTIGTGNPDNRDSEYDVLTDAYARMLIEEILPEVGKKYNLARNPASRAIGGASSGAICAFTVAWERPQEFRNVVSLIGSYTDIHGGHVYPQLVREAEKKPIRIFLQDGVNDNRSPNNPNRDWYLQNKKMVAALEEKGYDMAHVFGEGGHSDDHGGAILPQMLRWIWRDYPGVVPTESDLVAEAAAVRPRKVELFPDFDDKAKVDPSGVWIWERRRGRNRTTSKVQLTRSDDRLNGTYWSESARGTSEPSAVLAPEMIGNKIRFTVAREFNGRSFQIDYQGIVHKNEIVGWRLLDFNGAPRDSAWRAARAVSP